MKVAKSGFYYYDTAEMDIAKPNAFDFSKLVFLGILLAAVAAVWMFSTAHTTLIMAPVAPACGELTVSMPKGPYWKSPNDGKWTWQPNALVQRSVHGAGQDCTVEVQYQLSPITVEPEQHLAAAAAAWRLEEIAHGRQQIGEATLTWTALASEEEQPRVYYGVAPLNSQRMLTLYVKAKPGVTLLAAQVFDSLLQSIKYKDSGLVTKGAEIAKAVQADGLAALTAQFPSEVFSVKNESGAETGFLISRTTMVPGQNEAVLETVYYDPNSKAKFSRSRFATTNIGSFILYSWNGPGNSSPYATVRVEDGVLMAAVRGSRKMEYNLSDAAVSGQIAELAGWKLLKNGVPEAVIDMIESEGSITPVRINPVKTSAEPNDKESSVLFTSIAGSGFSSEVFFDPNGRVSKRIEHLEKTITIERTTAEHIRALFPELAEEITRFMNGGVGTVTRPKEIEYGNPI
jgi:hypothetical protein